MGFWNSLNNFLEGLEEGSNITCNKDAPKYYVTCPKCGYELRVYGRYGSVQCSECYTVIQYDT